MPFKLTWLPTVLKNAGLKVAEVDGWPNRGRGDAGEIKGVICHHTAGPKGGNMPSLGIVKDDVPTCLALLRSLALAGMERFTSLRLVVRIMPEQGNGKDLLAATPASSVLRQKTPESTNPAIRSTTLGRMCSWMRTAGVRPPF